MWFGLFGSAEVGADGGRGFHNYVDYNIEAEALRSAIDICRLGTLSSGMSSGEIDWFDDGGISRFECAAVIFALSQPAEQPLGLMTAAAVEPDAEYRDDLDHVLRQLFPDVRGSLMTISMFWISHKAKLSSEPKRSSRTLWVSTRCRMRLRRIGSRRRLSRFCCSSDRK